MLYFKRGRKKTDHTVNPQEDDNGWRSVGASESVSVLISGVQAGDFLWLQAGLLAGLIPTTTVFFSQSIGNIDSCGQPDRFHVGAKLQLGAELLRKSVDTSEIIAVKRRKATDCAFKAVGLLKKKKS